MFIEGGDRYMRRQAAPIGDFKGDVLEIVENTDSDGSHNPLPAERVVNISRVSAPASGGSLRSSNASPSIRIGSFGSLVAIPPGRTVLARLPLALSCGSSNKSSGRAILA